MGQTHVPQNVFLVSYDSLNPNGISISAAVIARLTSVTATD